MGIININERNYFHSIREAIYQNPIVADGNFVRGVYKMSAEVKMNKRVLVVEDEPIIALDIRSKLEDAGYQVTAILSSGEEAVEKVREINPDLILMDIFLGKNMDGIEATDRILKNNDIPVVFLSANADLNTMKRADATKNYGYLIKPISAPDLDAIVSIALERHQFESAAQHHR